MSSPFNFFDISYLKKGTSRQQETYEILSDLKLLEILNAYDPVLAGTIPLEIDIPSSDLDILCQAPNLNNFFCQMHDKFSDQKRFRIRRKKINSVDSVIVNFEIRSFAFEIFGQNSPVRKQNAYVHMTVEKRLLDLVGEKAKKAIRDLKSSGIKTEPAFAKYFGLKGDPYQTLLELAEKSDDELRSLAGGKIEA